MTAGARKINRSMSIPKRIKKETVRMTRGLDFALCESRTRNGMKKKWARTAMENSRRGEVDIRSWRKTASSGRFPYQITRNWE